LVVFTGDIIYRGSNSYTKTIKIIKKQIEKFLELNVKQIHDSFDKIDILEELEHLDKLDFNDLIIVKSIKAHKLKLLSDNRDFENVVDINWYI